MFFLVLNFFLFLITQLLNQAVTQNSRYLQTFIYAPPENLILDYPNTRIFVRNYRALG